MLVEYLSTVCLLLSLQIFFVTQFQICYYIGAK